MSHINLKFVLIPGMGRGERSAAIRDPAMPENSKHCLNGEAREGGHLNA